MIPRPLVPCALALLALALAACGDRRGKQGPGQPDTPTPPVYEGRETKQVLAAFPDGDRELVEQAERITLFTLNPHRVEDGKLSPETERLHTYGVTGKAEITEPQERRKLIEAVYRGLLGEGAGPAGCFFPRHALRFEKDGRTLDCLICFECTWIYLYGRAGSEGEDRLLFGAGVEPVFASIMKTHGLVKSD